MAQLIPVKYHSKLYPAGIVPKVEELAAHFDKTGVNPSMNYSLHTEYSYIPRKFDSSLLAEFNVLKLANKDFVPQLWASKEWACEFCEFIKKIVGNNKSPKIIEVHPPFNDYCNSIADFVEIYKEFEKRILVLFPETLLVIENRSGSRYKGGKFLISTSEDLLELHKAISQNKLKLKIVLDFPQLFTSYNLNTGRFTKEKLSNAIRPLFGMRQSIAGIHIWGKKDHGHQSHQGNLDTYFVNQELKKTFLEFQRQFE